MTDKLQDEILSDNDILSYLKINYVSLNYIENGHYFVHLIFFLIIHNYSVKVLNTQLQFFPHILSLLRLQ